MSGRSVLWLEPSANIYLGLNLQEKDSRQFSIPATPVIASYWKHFAWKCLKQPSCRKYNGCSKAQSILRQVSTIHNKQKAIPDRQVEQNAGSSRLRSSSSAFIFPGAVSLTRIEIKPIDVLVEKGLLSLSSFHCTRKKCPKLMSTSYPLQLKHCCCKNISRFQNVNRKHQYPVEHTISRKIGPELNSPES